MSEFKTTVTHTFSRVKNGLAELQRWWPCYVKDTGAVRGLSVDPVLFKSSFGPKDVTEDGDLVDEASTGGVRVEAIMDDGTDVTGTEPTIVISGSGGFAPKARVNHADGSFTEVLFIAPSGEGKVTLAEADAAGSVRTNTQSPAGGAVLGLRSPGGSLTGTAGSVTAQTYTPDKPTTPSGTNDTNTHVQTGPTDTAGPFPVFMTIQEFAEWLDTYRHIGAADDSGKKAWLPHGIIGNTETGVASAAAMPAVNADPRLTAGDAVFPTVSPYRATVFMPMLLDNNQLAKTITGAKNDVATFYNGKNLGTAGGYAARGISRYTQNPAATSGLVPPATDNYHPLVWKTFGESGDHLIGAHGSFNFFSPYGSMIFSFKGKHWLRGNAPGLDINASGGNHVTTILNDFSSYQANPDMSADSSATQGPKYRMKMALACFLKDGTYSLNNGTIIPYTYDPSRYIGGQTTTTLYSTWDGMSGVGSLMDSSALSGHTIHTETSAQIWPMFDFVQGPLTPSAQGQNFHLDVVGGGASHWDSFKTFAISQTVNYASLYPEFTANQNWFMGWAVSTIQHVSNVVQRVQDGEAAYGDFVRYGRDVLASPGTDPSADHQPREWLTRPNPKRARILAIERTGRTGVTNFAWDDDPSSGLPRPEGGVADPDDVGGSLILYVGVEGAAFSFVHNGNGGVSNEPRFGPNSPIYIDGLTGALGSGVNDKTLTAHWPGRVTGIEQEIGLSGGFTSVSQNARNYNGWWLITGIDTVASSGGTSTDFNQKVYTADMNTIVPGSTTGLVTYVRYQINIGPGSNHIKWSTISLETGTPTAGTDAAGSDLRVYGESAVAAYETPGAHIRESRLGGPMSGGSAATSPSTMSMWGGLPDGQMVASWSAGAKAAPGSFYFIYGNQFAENQLQGTLILPYDARAGVSFQAGIVSSDSNVPIGANTESTYPGRIAIDDPSLDFSTSNKHIASEKRFGLVAEDDQTITVSPIVSTKGGGVLRVGAPIGWDLASRYYASHMKLFAGGDTFPSVDGANLPSSSHYQGDPNPDMPDPANPGHDYERTAVTYKGGTTDVRPSEQVDSLPWLNVVSQLTNSNTEFQDTPDRWGHRGLSTPFWSYIEQTTGKHAWDHVKPPGWTFGRNRPWPAHERMGTRLGYGNSLLPEAYNGWDTTAWPTHQDFVASGEETTKIGVSEIGCSPVWLDMEMIAFVPSQTNRLTIIEFDSNDADPVFGRHHMMSSALNRGCGFGFQPLFDGGGNSPLTVSGNRVTGVSTVFTSGTQLGPFVGPPPSKPWEGSAVYYSGQALYAGAVYGDGQGYVRNRPCIFMGGGQTHWSDYTWENSHLPGTGTGGFGNMGGGTGYGGAFSYTEGTHTLRATFVEKGMVFSLDGSIQGTDLTQSSPVWGMSIKAANIMSFPLRNSGNYLNSPVPPESIVPDNLTPKDSSDRFLYSSNPVVQISPVDLQVDSLILRHIPSAAMVPFTCDTIKIHPATDIAKYTSLVIEADNISKSKGMNVTATIMEIPTITTIAPEATTEVVGFVDLDMAFAGGVGSIDLTALPAAQVTNGFVVRFNFKIPDSGSDLHPIDWSKTPFVKSWSAYFDLKPKVELAVVGNTFDGTTASTVGQSTTQSVTSKVGHIVSFRIFGDTLDPDRKIKYVKIDFGDGVVTNDIPVPVETESVTYDIAHVYTDRPAAGYYDVTATVTDDNENVSDTLTPVIRVNLANAEPIALLQTVPAVTRAGQAVTLTGASSYTVDLLATLTNFAFTPGDGSAVVSGSASSIQHTYAAAGEYQSTLVVTDSNTTTSGTASAIVKVLPATLVVPLTLNTMPAQFKRTRQADFSTTPVLDAVYPELNDTGHRADTFEMTGTFLKTTANQDIAFMEELLLSGSLIEFEWEAVNFSGTPTGKTFVGRLTAFNYERKGGDIGQTPWSATLIREAGLTS